MLRKISTFWVILAAVLVTSALALVLMAFNAIQTTSSAVEREQIVQLTARVGAHASAIGERLNAFANATRLAATEAKDLLLDHANQLTPEQLQGIMRKYTRDPNGVLGLDAWYNSTYYPEYHDARQSNVFLNKNTQLTPELEQAIAATEKLNPLFESIHSSQIGTQWIYLTLANGMMRLYPWAGNEGYPPDWEPQTISFYTVADGTRDPTRGPVWTTPYNDFAGAGLMVTNSYPIYNGDTLVAVMSHDFVIKDLQQQVLGFKVGKEGYAFLLDDQGHIIAHPDYAPENTALGEELKVSLADQEPYMSEAVTQIMNSFNGTTTVTDLSGTDWVLVYTHVTPTYWHLGLMQPRSEIIQPALNIANQLRVAAVALIILALVVSVILARWISHPVIQLSESARQIEASVDMIDISITGSQSASPAASLSGIHGTREITHLVAVFGEMVNALYKRINELGLTYVLGQTITATIDYEQTLRTVLEAMRQALEADAADISLIQDHDLVTAAWSGQAGLEDRRGRSSTLVQGLRGQVIQSKAVLWIPTPDLLPAGLDSSASDELAQRAIYSFLGAPLVSKEKLIGVLALENYRACDFSEDNRRQLQRLTALASIAIDNAIQVRQREQVLKDQIRVLKIEIDEVRKNRQVEEIVESDFFTRLQDQAARMRRKAKSGDSSPDK